ncbi:MAG: response regulator transcription factor [Anaerolineae bacterium]|nr:response regulator transcription factor [Anaerolineae bacterium]
MTPQTILVVDDEPTIREVVRKYLEQEGFRVIEAETGPAALDCLQNQPPDLIVLDIMLPGMDGLAITRVVRDPTNPATLQTQGDVPIILLTARGEEIDRLVGFEVGADDYVVKPFSPRELVHRVRAVLRRHGGGSPGDDRPLSFGDVRIDPRSRQVTVRGDSVSLTAKEFDLLWFLARHPRQVFSREQLLDQVWGYEFVGDASTVTVHIRRLREKIEADPGNPMTILTVWGVGYKLEIPVD